MDWITTEVFWSIFSSVGAIGICAALVKAIIDRVLSSKIEIALETNYQLVFRLLFDSFIWFVLISMYVILFLYLIDSKNISVSPDVITNGQNIMTKDDFDSWFTVSQKQSYLDFFKLLLILFVVWSYCYLGIRFLYDSFYQKAVYIKLESHKKRIWHVVKRINKEYVLLKTGSKRIRYKIVSLSYLENYELIVESPKNRSNRRYKNIYNTFQDFRSLTKFRKFIIFIGSIAIIIGTTLVQENKRQFIITLIVTLLFLFIYLIYQYKKGSGLVNKKIEE